MVMVGASDSRSFSEPIKIYGLIVKHALLIFINK